MILSFFLFLFMTPNLEAGKLPVPRFVSLKSSEVNQRVGPGPHYPIGWVYRKASLPVEIVAEFDNWRKIRDSEGVEGWVHQNMVCARRYGIIQDTEVLLYASSDSKSRPLARLEKEVLIELLKCSGSWCYVRVHSFKGWVPRSSVWGIYPHETFG